MTHTYIFHSDHMPIELPLSEATGTLHPAGHNARSEDDPLLSGSVLFDVTSRWHVSVQRVPVDAWLDMRGGKLRYRLSLGGIPGWMGFRMRIAGVGPDYIGAAGLHDELQVAGWRNKLQSGESPSLTLMLYSSSLGNELLERLLARSLGTGN